MFYDLLTTLIAGLVGFVIILLIYGEYDRQRKMSGK